MTMSPSLPSRRIFLKTAASAIGAGILSPWACSARRSGQQCRRILACSDIHVGYREDGLDGGEWFDRALADVRDAVGPVDYALVLGDIAHHGRREEFQRYAASREGGPIGAWYELAGNHDFYDDTLGHFTSFVNPRRHYVVTDGNVVFFFLSDDLPGTQGDIDEQTYERVRSRLARYRDRIVIMCTHQLVFGTIRHSTVEIRYIHPPDRVADLLASRRIDIWLCGHQHRHPHAHSDVQLDKTTAHINVASLSHAYNTGESQSFIVELQPGGREVAFLRRSHDSQTFMRNFSFTVPVPQAIALSKPVVEAL